MYRKGDGIWRLSITLEPGQYEYKFFTDGHWQNDPSARQRVPNGLGTENSVKIVV